MNIGLVGIGIMGSRICEKLLREGFSVCVWDIDSEKTRQVSELGASVASSISLLTEDVEVIMMLLPGPTEVSNVVSGDKGILSAAKSGQVIIDLSTVDPGCSQRNSQLAAQIGVGYLDAPILGRPDKCGYWTIAVGGEAEQLSKVKTVLEAIASRVVHVGTSGHGNVLKLLNNLMFGTINSITCEILAVCAAVGMEPRLLFNTIAESGAGTVSNLFREIGPKIIDREFAPQFKVDHMYKDVMLGLKMAREANIPMFISPATQLLIEMARAKGYGHEDSVAVVKIYEEYSGVKVE